MDCIWMKMSYFLCLSVTYECVYLSPMKEKDYPIFAMRFKSPDSETNQDGETRLFLVSMKNKYSRN